MDICDYPGIDIVRNIEDTPWPIEDNQFKLIRAQHILEHIKDGIAFINILNEIWRVGKPGAIFIGEVPRYDSPNFFRDPTHVRPLSEHSFDMFLEDTKIHAGSGYQICCKFRKHKIYVNQNRDVVWELEVVK
jgi:SAM-dependent methyltransferase